MSELRCLYVGRTKKCFGVTVMNKKMKYTSKNGYTGVMYGESSFVVLNKDGEEVMHTGSRAFNTYEELIKQVEAFPEFWAMHEEAFLN